MASVTHILAAGTTVEGQLRGEGDLTVAGVIRGGVELRGTLSINEGGSIVGDVRCQQLVVAGKLHGDVVVEGRTAVRQGATLQGSLVTGRLDVQGGARIQASIETLGGADTLPPPPVQPRPNLPGPSSAGPDAAGTDDDASTTTQWSVGTTTHASAEEDADSLRDESDDTDSSADGMEDEVAETGSANERLGDDPGVGDEGDDSLPEADSDDP
jgi:cytoskeletal protein CcmA (bactofilin family)